MITLRRLRIEADYFGLDDLLGTINAVRPSFVEVPVLLESRNWSRMTPRRVEDEDGRSRLEWTQQSGNEAILSFHRTVIIPSFDMSKKDEMIVGETGIYTLFLRVHICLSPLTFGDETFEYPGVIIGQHDTAIADWRDGTYGQTLSTATCAEVVKLLKGDRLWIDKGHFTSDTDQVPHPADVPHELLNSLTLVKVHGNTLARYERLKQNEKSPVPDDGSGSTDSEPVHSATWSEASHGLPPTPFVPSISEDRHEIIAPRRGQCFGSVQLLVHESSQHCMHAIKQFDVAGGSREMLYPLYNKLSRDGDGVHARRYVELNDIVHMETGFEISVAGDGNVTIRAENSDCDLRTQNLSLFFLSKSQRQERFTIKTITNSTNGNLANDLEIAWLSSISPYETAQPSCFERGLDKSGRFDHTLRMKEDQGTFLVLGSLPCLKGPHRELLLFVNDGAVAMSKVIEQFRVISHTSHNFHEILELKRAAVEKLCCATLERQSFMPTENESFRALWLGSMGVVPREAYARDTRPVRQNRIRSNIPNEQRGSSCSKHYMLKSDSVEAASSDAPVSQGGASADATGNAQHVEGSMKKYPISILVGAPGRSHDTAEARVLSRKREAHASCDWHDGRARQVMGSVRPEIRRLVLLTDAVMCSGTCTSSLTGTSMDNNSNTFSPGARCGACSRNN
eukprot:scaffold58408_cov30-Attheya_sp.AAC.1